MADPSSSTSERRYPVLEQRTTPGGDVIVTVGVSDALAADLTASLVGVSMPTKEDRHDGA